jgi:hypothetical protein
MKEDLMPDGPDKESKVVHQFRNHLAVVISFADLLLLEMPESDPHRKDVLEILKAATSAMAMIPEIGGSR